MSDVSPYGTTQHPDAAAVTADALVGERAGNVTAHQADAMYSPALFSTAPYIPPKKTEIVVVADIVMATGPKCKYKNCRQPRRDGFVYCDRHVGGGD